MREENAADNRSNSKVSKFADQNQIPKLQNAKATSNHSKPRLASSWGAHIVKGFTAEKRAKQQQQQSTIPSKKQPLTNSDVANQKNPFVPAHSRVKRSLIGDLSCSINAAQVHPHGYANPNGNPAHRRQSSTDLFTELDHMRSLLQESKERELKLQAELSECKRNQKELDEVVKRVASLEEEKASLSEQLTALACVSERQEEVVKGERNDGDSSATILSSSSTQNLELEVVELRRLNKELQMQKRSLTCRLSSLESQMSRLAKSSQVMLKFTVSQGVIVN